MKKDQVIIKKSNVKLFLSALLENRPISRTDLAKKIDISPTSVTRISSLLINKGLIVETSTVSKGIGRHAVMLDTIPGSSYALGIELISRAVRFAVTDLHGDCVAIKSVAYNVSQNPAEELAKFTYDESMLFLAENSIPYDKIIGIGVAVPGIVNHSSEIVEFSSQLKWKNENILVHLRPLFNKPMIIENDTKARIRGEKASHNIPEGIDSAILVIGSGVSAAAVSRGNVMRGFRNAAGEIGHITLETDGVVCDCGRKGCLQTRLCDKFLIAEAQKHDVSVASVTDIVNAYNQGKEWAEEIFRKFRATYHIALDILESCYNPAVIIVSGHVVEHIKPMLEKWSEEYSREKGRSISIIVTVTKSNIAAVGSSIIALDTYITDLVDDINI